MHSNLGPTMGRQTSKRGINMGQKTILLIIVAVLCGGAALYMVNRYVSEEITEYRESVDAQYEPVQVVVAAADLSRGDLLTTNNLQVRDVPKSFVHRDAVRPSEVDSIMGANLLYALGSGEPLLATHVQHSSVDAFSNLIEVGKRAMTFPVDTLSSISGMITPGDVIDIFGTLKNGEEESTVPLLTNIRVMATGESVGAANGDFDNNNGPQNRYQNITLHVEPAVAAKIAHARSVGTLSVVLRSRIDQLPMELEPVTTRTLLGKAAYRQIPIIRGGS